MPGEFELIERYFRTGFPSREDVVVGIGDDAAVLAPPPAGRQLVVAVDTLVEGVHFPPDFDAADLGYRALAVNLSDLAAMGAEPAWMTLALTLPKADEAWLVTFARGLREAAAPWRVALVGGDTTRGPLTVTIQLLGTVPAGQAIRRSGARAGDGVHVTGTPGDAAMGLLCLQRGIEGSAAEHCRRRFARPEPRLALGHALRGLASAMIDISDGLLADLDHLLDASGVGATIQTPRVPRSDAFRDCLAALPESDRTRAAHFPLAGGDDYELCFTVPPEHEAEVCCIAERLGVPVTRIGTIEMVQGLRVMDEDGRNMVVKTLGYDHFRENG